MNEKKNVEQFDTKNTPGATDLLPFWDFTQKMMVRLSFTSLITWLKTLFALTDHNHDTVYLKTANLRSSIRPAVTAEATKVASEKAVAEAIAAINVDTTAAMSYDINFNLNYDHVDYFEVASNITDIKLVDGIAALQYRFNNAGAYTTVVLPLVDAIEVSADTIVNWKISQYQVSRNSGTIFIKTEKI